MESVGDDVVDEILEHQFTTPGVFNLPVCGASEAGDNWWAHSNKGKGRHPKHYPCD